MVNDPLQPPKSAPQLRLRDATGTPHPADPKFRENLSSEGKAFYDKNQGLFVAMTEDLFPPRDPTSSE
jgi:hypothetical protein